MFVYDVNLATPGNLTTNGSANTESEAYFIKPGSTRSIGIRRLDIGGKAAGLTALSGIVARMMQWGTASTSGTSITPRPRDAGMPAAAATAASRPTAGSTRTNGPIISCSVSGPNVWQAWDYDGIKKLAAGNAGSLSMADASGTVSLNYESSLELIEW